MDYVQGPISARVPAAARTPEQWGWATSAVAAVGGGGGILQLTHPSAAPQGHPHSSLGRPRMIPQPCRGSAYTASVSETQGMSPMSRRLLFPVTDFDDAVPTILYSRRTSYPPSHAPPDECLYATRNPGRSASPTVTQTNDLNSLSGANCQSTAPLAALNAATVRTHGR